MPKKFGGWNILNMECFSNALRMKIFWRAMFVNSLWNEVLVAKYIKNDIVTWLRDLRFLSGSASNVWLDFLKVLGWNSCKLA